jgi:hypothetical protein
MARDDTARLRAYLLGAATEEESVTIEEAYFEQPDDIHRLRSVEDDLIEDYLAGRLSGEDRGQFERHYLASPGHRARVAVIAKLRGAAAATPAWWSSRWIAAAAALVVVAWIAWSVVPRPAPEEASGAPPPRLTRPDEPLPRPPLVAAVTLAPLLTRGVGEPATVTNSGADIIRLQLEGDADGRAVSGRRVTIRTVSGAEVWSGPAGEPDASRPREIASVDVPAARLRRDDYVVTLFGTANGREVEQSRYYLRVR